MENIVSNPGLQHLAENIFWNLNVKNLKICGLINQSCQQILDNPMFWLRKFEHLSKANQKDWIKVIQSETNSEKKRAIIAYLQWNLKKFEKPKAVISQNLELEKMKNLPCYSNPDVQEDFKKRIREICEKEEISDQDIEIVKILAPLTDNPNAPVKLGKTPIYWAACKGYTEIVKILAPLTDSPNAPPDRDGKTPLYWAEKSGNWEIVKILKSFKTL